MKLDFVTLLALTYLQFQCCYENAEYTEKEKLSEGRNYETTNPLIIPTASRLYSTHGIAYIHLQECRHGWFTALTSLPCTTPQCPFGSYQPPGYPLSLYTFLQHLAFRQQ